MLTARVGAAGFASAAKAMALHLLRQTLPQFQAALAAYYQRGLAPARGPNGEPGTHEVATAEPRPDMDPRLAKLLGLDPNRVPTVDEIAEVLAGNRADGLPIPGKRMQRETRSLADELGLDASRAPSAKEIGRVLAGCRADTGAELAEERADILQGRFLALYGATEGQALSPEAHAHVRAGRRVDGETVRLGQMLERLGATRARVGYIDLCWSADKSVSLAWAMAPTEAERNMIAQAHKDAVASTMRHVETEVGRARKGGGGMGGYDPGHVGWISFDHYASRPTVEMARTDPRTGQAYTELVTLKVAGDPQLHTHVAVPNVVLTKDGRVAALDLQRLDGRVHEFGALYQAYLASNLRRHGAEVVLDVSTGAARLPAIPDQVRDAFSKRTRHGTEAARAYASSAGLDWDTLDEARKVGLAKQGVQGDPRQAKQDDLGDWASWHRQAEVLGWEHRSIFDPARVQEVTRAPGPEREMRLEHAYRVARDLFDVKLQRRAVLDGADARVAAARGLVAAGVAGPEDIDAVTRAFVRRGVRQDGQDTQLLWGMSSNARGKEVARLTTVLQADREAELVRLARTAAADRSGALTAAAIEAAVGRAEATTDVNFARDEHSRTQRRVMDRLGQGGRLTVAIGVAGAGKSTLLAPLVDAWHAERRKVHGAALAWRQTEDFAKAGIPEARRAAMSVFLNRAGSGEIALGRDSVVVVDELALLGTRQLLDLLRLQERHGFVMVAVGDPLQCRSIEAGPVVDLLRRALGPDAIPEILTTVRQKTEREQETSLLFRKGDAAEALAIKREDGTARLVAGDYDQAVAGIAALWQKRRVANAHDANYSLSVSAPTNRDARAIGAAIREHRRAAGELEPEERVLQACDQGGDAYELPLAVGDRVRLFARTNGACTDRKRGSLGNNGSVLEVRALDDAGVTLRNAFGREGLVTWDTLRDPRSGRIRLSYGDVLTIDATQGLTSTEHIEAMPAGTRAVDAYKAYTAASRHRRATYVMVADGAERKEVAGRRPLGDMRPISDADVWANVARNLSRQPEQDSALSFLEKAHATRRAATVSLQAGLKPLEQRQADGLAPTTLPLRLQRHGIMERLQVTLERLANWAWEQAQGAEQLARVLPEVQAAVADAVGGLRPALQRAAYRIHNRPERVEARRRTAQLVAMREHLVDLRMTAFREEQPPLTLEFSAEEMSRVAKIRKEEARQRQAISGLPETELREALRQEMERQREIMRVRAEAKHEQAQQQERERQEQARKQHAMQNQPVVQPPPPEYSMRKPHVSTAEQALRVLWEADSTNTSQEVQYNTSIRPYRGSVLERIALAEQKVALEKANALPKQEDKEPDTRPQTSGPSSGPGM